jgi:hypothetical protein
MKRFSTLLLTAAVAIATSVSAVAQTADEIVQKHIAAIGGADAWRKVNTMKMTGAMKMGGMEIPVVMTMEHNKGMRFDMTAMGMENYMIVTPSAGWVFFPVQGQPKPEPMTAEQVKQMSEQLDIQNDLLDYTTKGHTVELQGKEDIEGTECFKLRMKKKGGTETVYFIDPSNYYIVREVEKATVDGKEMEEANNFSNYQKLDGGVIMPMTMEGGMGPMTFTAIEINKPVDAKIFEPSKG